MHVCFFVSLFNNVMIVGVVNGGRRFLKIMDGITCINLVNYYYFNFYD